MNALSVIKYEGDNNVLVWKSDIEDFNIKSQLIVNESQEAIFYKDGQALDLFGPGRHSLNSDNLPLFKRLVGKIFGGNNPLSCQVYYINKVNVMDMLWGTDAPITIEDPKYHLIIGVRSNGQTGVRIVDSRKFILKIVGQLDTFSVENMKKSIKGLMITQIKQVIAKTILELGVSILDISTKFMELSDLIKKELNERLSDIGVELVHFYVNAINCTDSDIAKLKSTKEKYLEAMTDIDIEAIKEVRLGEAKAKSRSVQGFTYQEERKYDVLEGAAKNEGTSGTMLGAGMGLGMGVGLGAPLGGAMGETASSAMKAEPEAAGPKCAKCGAQLRPGAKFCSECGAKVEEHKPRFCSQCGHKLEETDKFCPVCGTKFNG